jgi:hypothetical protein
MSHTPGDVSVSATALSELVTCLTTASKFAHRLEVLLTTKAIAVVSVGVLFTDVVTEPLPKDSAPACVADEALPDKAPENVPAVSVFVLGLYVNVAVLSCSSP